MRGLTPDQVEQALRAEESIIASARGRQMALLGLAAAMQLHTADGCRTIREWVVGRLDLSPESAFRLTSTASRLADAPDVAHDLVNGEITFDRAEALSRIPAGERANWHLGLDIPGLRRLASKHHPRSRQDDHISHQASRLAMQPNLDKSNWRVWGDLDGYSGSVVDKVLTERGDEIGVLPDGSRPGLEYRRAAALTALCEDSQPSGNGNTPLISVFVDELGAEMAGGTPVGPEVLDKVACVGSLEVILKGDGKPLGIGRRSRVIPGRLRRFVLHRDGGCVADGCTSRYRLEAHHKVPWSEWGPTEPDNLITLCWFHHHVVIHGWGYRIDERFGSGRIRFIKPPDGRDPPRSRIRPSPS